VLAGRGGPSAGGPWRRHGGGGSGERRFEEDWSRRTSHRERRDGNRGGEDDPRKHRRRTSATGGAVRHLGFRSPAVARNRIRPICPAWPPLDATVVDTAVAEIGSRRSKTRWEGGSSAGDRGEAAASATEGGRVRREMRREVREEPVEGDEETQFFTM